MRFISDVLQKAREEGIDAFEKEEGIDSNPYLLGTAAAQEWADGWLFTEYSKGKWAWTKHVTTN